VSLRVQHRGGPASIRAGRPVSVRSLSVSTSVQNRFGTRSGLGADFVQFVIDLPEVVVLAGFVGSYLLYDVIAAALLIVYFVEGESAVEIVSIVTVARVNRIEDVSRSGVVDVFSLAKLARLRIPRN
jgi:hypothetical protein